MNTKCLQTLTWAISVQPHNPVTYKAKSGSESTFTAGVKIALVTFAYWWVLELSLLHNYYQYPVFIFVFLSIFSSACIPFHIGVAVSDEPSPSCPVVCFYFFNPFLSDVFLHSVDAHFSWSASLSSVHSQFQCLLPNVCLFSPQYVPAPSQSPFLDILRYFSRFCWPSHMHNYVFLIILSTKDWCKLLSKQERWEQEDLPLVL